MYRGRANGGRGRVDPLSAGVGSTQRTTRYNVGGRIEAEGWGIRGGG